MQLWREFTLLLLALLALDYNACGHRSVSPATSAAATRSRLFSYSVPASQLNTKQLAIQACNSITNKKQFALLDSRSLINGFFSACDDGLLQPFNVLRSSIIGQA
jgi:hypothetical protein